MAYLQQRDDEQQQAGQPTSAPVISSAPVAPAASATGIGAPQAPAQQPKADRFSTIRGFLDSNREQGQALAQRVGNTVGANLQSAQDAQAKTAQDWQQNALAAKQDWERRNADAYSAWQAQQLQEWIRAPRGNRGHANYGQPSSAFQPLERPAAPEAPTFDTSAAKTARDQMTAFGGDLASDTAALRNVTGSGSQLDAALLGQAAPNLGNDLSNRYANILSALENPTAPAVPLTETEKAARRLQR